MIRRQLPVYSPITFASLVRAFGSAWGAWSSDPRGTLGGLLRDRYQADRVVLTGSGTQALTLALRLALAQRDAPVAIPAFTCYDVATATVGAGCQVLLYDLDPQTLGPDWTSLESALEQGAGSMVVAYLYGVPVDWRRAQDLASRYGALLIEDAAQGMGGSWHGRRLGSLGSLSVLSFGRGKGWTGGRGGALLVRSELPSGVHELRYRSLDELGVAAAAIAQWLLARPAVYGIPYRLPWLQLGKTRYRDPVPPRAMTRTAAALILETLGAAEQAAAGRRRVGERLMETTRRGAAAEPIALPKSTTPGYLRFPCRVRSDRVRRQLLERLAGAGVAESYPLSLGHLRAVGDRLNATRRTPGADALANELITLPTHSLLTDRDLSELTTGLLATREV